MKPQDYHPLKPHDCRRAKFHNYKAPGFYMITVSKDPNCPVFSSLHGDPFNPTDPIAVSLTDVGAIIDAQIKCIEDWDFFEIHNFVIMPDHVHILWQVKYWLENDLGHYIGLFKSRCSTNCGKLLQKKTSVFLDKFNDKIAFDDAMTWRFYHYISDNPRRRQIVRLYPQLFQRVQAVEIGDFELDLYGNFQLLKHPMITPAIVSSRYSEQEKAYWKASWEETIRTGGVLISPFIADDEKALMARGIAEGVSIIRIIPDGIPPKYKPHGEEFDLCAQGRCLHIGPLRLSRRKHKVTRPECLAYNDLARWIADHSGEVMNILNAKAQIR